MSHGQTKRGSMAEACLNVAIGYGVALVSQLVVFPLYGVNVPLSTNIAIGVWFTVISCAVVRAAALVQSADGGTRMSHEYCEHGECPDQCVDCDVVKLKALLTTMRREHHFHHYHGCLYDTDPPVPCTCPIGYFHAQVDDVLGPYVDDNDA